MGTGREFGLTPRSTQARLQPRTQRMDVAPLGASTTNSKSGAVDCAFAAIQPLPMSASAVAIRAKSRGMTNS
jgi:hypothetical protein